MRKHGDIIPSQVPLAGTLAHRLQTRANELARRGDAVKVAPSHGTAHEQLGREAILRATHFDPAWGTPPVRPGLAWDRERLLLVPVLADEPGPGGSIAQEHGALVSLARRGFYRQWHVGHDGAWGLRWVRAFTDVPDPATPYELVRDDALPLRRG